METAVEPTPKPQTNDRTWAMICHLSVLSAFVIPLGNIIGPLVVWLAKRDESAEVQVHGKAALNFQLTLMIIGIILFILFAIVAIGFFGAGAALMTGNSSAFAAGGFVTTLVVGGILSGAFFLWSFILVIVNSIRAYDGKAPYYVPSFRLIR